jgi:hypothetical protein
LIWALSVKQITEQVLEVLEQTFSAYITIMSMSVSKQLILVQLTRNTNKVTSVTIDSPNGMTANKKE